MDAVLEFQIESKSTGKQLFDLVTRTIGVREVWYFGLRYINVKGFTTWLRFDKKVLDQNVPKDKMLSFQFRAKFFPEDLGDELVQELTQHLFYLQVKASIVSEDVYCSPEAAVLLASYAIQAEYGDFDPELYHPGFLANEKILPQRVIDQYRMTPEMWEERITSSYAQHKGMLREEAELEYMRVAQDLEMLGVNYFDITNKKGTKLWMGVDAFGLNIYEQDDQLSPKISFPWGEIRNVEYHGKKFCIKPSDKKSPSFVFYVSKTRISDLIMQLCMGNHELYMKRRRLDTMEVQQMKAQAKEERARKLAERDRLEREKIARKEAELKQQELERKLQDLEEETRRANEARLQIQKMMDLLNEKVKVAEEEAQSHARKNFEATEEIRRVRATAVKSEEDRLAMERRIQLAEENSSTKRDLEADELRRELEEARMAERMAKIQLEETRGPLSPSLAPSTATVAGITQALPGTADASAAHSSSPELVETPHGEAELYEGGDMDELSKQLEKESINYQEKYKYITEKLSVLRTEMDDLKREDGQSHLDIIHNDNVRQGSTKRKLLDQSKSGPPKTRIAFYEEL